MELPLISIIVPVYNSEKYLVECLESIKNQTYENIEVLLVDDGSNDNSGKICDQYANVDKRFKVIHQENKGVSSARNQGIQCSSGEFVMFVDSDDWLEKNCCEILAKSLDSSNIDALVFELFYEEAMKSHKTNALKKISKTSTIEELEKIKIACIPFRDNDTEDNMVFFGPYCKLLKSEYVKSTKFLETLKYGEDAIFNFEVFSKMKNIKFVYENLYHYRKNDGSITGKFKIDRNQQSILRLKYTWSLLEKQRKFNAEYKRAFEEMYVNIVLFVLNNLGKTSDVSIKNCWEEIKYLAQDEWMRKQWLCIKERKNVPIMNCLFSKSKILALGVLIRIKFL